MKGLQTNTLIYSKSCCDFNLLSDTYKIGFSHRIYGMYFSVFLTYESLEEIFPPREIFSKLGRIKCEDIDKKLFFVDQIEQNKLVQEVNIFNCTFLRIDYSSKTVLYEMEMSGHVYVFEHSVAYSCFIDVKAEIVRGLANKPEKERVIRTFNSYGSNCWKFSCFISDDNSTRLHIDEKSKNRVIIHTWYIMPHRRTHVTCGSIPIVVLEFGKW